MIPYFGTQQVFLHTQPFLFCLTADLFVSLLSNTTGVKQTRLYFLLVVAAWAFMRPCVPLSTNLSFMTVHVFNVCTHSLFSTAPTKMPKPKKISVNKIFPEELKLTRFPLLHVVPRSLGVSHMVCCRLSVAHPHAAHASESAAAWPTPSAPEESRSVEDVGRQGPLKSLVRRA